MISRYMVGGVPDGGLGATIHGEEYIITTLFETGVSEDYDELQDDAATFLHGVRSISLVVLINIK